MANRSHDGQSLVTPIWVMGVALLLALLVVRWIASTASNFQDLALGEQTASVFGTLDGDTIFCGSIKKIDECLAPARQRNLARRVIWLGNSQLHAINQVKPGDTTAPVQLAAGLRPKGVEVLGFSMPNASLIEMLVAANFLASDRRIDVLIVPLFLDDTRVQAVREDLRLAADPADRKAELQQLASGRFAIAQLNALANSDVPAESSATTLQQKSEMAVTTRLEQCCGLESMRFAAHGQIDVQAYLLRNWVFGITPQSVRPVLPVAYQQNLAALEDIFRIAQRNSTRVIAYIPPLRQDFKPPYDPQQYQAFKAQTRALAQRYGVRWIDFDRLVPGRYWGTKAATSLGGKAELDFMHYQEPGHAMLAQAMAPQVEAALK